MTEYDPAKVTFQNPTCARMTYCFSIRPGTRNDFVISKSGEDPMMTTTEPWICRACNVQVSTRYCPGCGERTLNPRDLTIFGLTDQVVIALTSFDTRLVRTFRRLITRP